MELRTMKYNKLIPEISVSDFARSLDFYTRLLGFKVEYQLKEPDFAFLSLKGAQVMIEHESGYRVDSVLEHPYGRGVSHQIEIADIAPLIERLQQDEYPIAWMPEEVWYETDRHLHGQLQFWVMDPDGHLLRFYQDLGIKPITE